MRSTKAQAVIVRDGNTLLITLTGDIDHHSAKRLRGEIDGAFYLHRPKRAVMDLSGVEFMDSAGLGLILGRLSRAQELGSKLTLLSPSPRVMKILDLAGAGRFIEIRQNDGKGA
ncbi:MAG TPA: STAS domain-containing protein [Bacillota bacterium]|nr:STAS domain-containing protein [Bacillota bacterium]